VLPVPKVPTAFCGPTVVGEIELAADEAGVGDANVLMTLAVEALGAMATLPPGC